MHDQLFGDLRSVLQRPPSDEAWAALCQQLDLWPAEPLESLALPYTLEHLERWPAALRCEAPRAWASALLDGRPCPQLGCARSLMIIVFPGTSFPQPIHMPRLDTSSLRSLRELTLLPSTLDAAALCAWLGGTRHLDALRSLSIISERLDDAQLTLLAAEPALSRLTSLALRQGYDITARGAHALAASPHLANLTALDLFYAKLRDEGAHALATSPHLTRLTSLDLTANAITPVGARALASAPQLARLQTLSLPRNPLGADGADALLTSPHLTRLASLMLRECQIPTSALETLAQQGATRGIAALDLADNPAAPPAPRDDLFM